MAESKSLIKLVLALCVWYMMTNVQSAELFDSRDICLTCTPMPPPTTSPSTQSTTPPTTQPTTPLTPCRNCPPHDCSMVPEGTTFPYASHCKLYYKCIDRSAVMCTCANGYWYDRQLNICQQCPLVFNCPANID